MMRVRSMLTPWFQAPHQLQSLLDEACVALSEMTQTRSGL